MRETKRLQWIAKFGYTLISQRRFVDSMIREGRIEHKELLRQIAENDLNNLRKLQGRTV